MNQSALLDPTLRQKSQAQAGSSWIAIIGFVVLSAGCMVAGAGKILTFAFPAGAFAVSLLLYFKSPVLYVGFCWWICLLSPFVRRVADYKSGYTENSPILLSTFLVAFVSLIGFYQCIPKCHRQGSLPFVLAAIAVIYASLIGLVNQSPVGVFKGVCGWLAPVLFGHHLFVNWRNYPVYRKTLQQTFVWGVLVVGAYGIYQYLHLPEWDSFWLTNSGFNSLALGAIDPEAESVRVFSTLNSPEPFAAIISSGLLLLFSSGSVVQLPSFVAGGLALLLSSVRSGWLALAVGFVALTASANLKFQVRLVIIAIVLGVCLIPLATMEPFSNIIQGRLESLNNVEDDGSATIRKATYAELIGRALVSFLGDGIAGSTYDSSILAMLLNLGWLGTVFYAGGLLMLLWIIFRDIGFNGDPFLSAVRAILVGILIRFPVNSPMTEESGIALWTFLGIGAAALKYYKRHPAENDRAIYSLLESPESPQR
jgi:hypothetical protein